MTGKENLLAYLVGKDDGPEAERYRPSAGQLLGLLQADEPSLFPGGQAAPAGAGGNAAGAGGRNAESAGRAAYAAAWPSQSRRGTGRATP